jgi:hypothetical protein
MFKGDADRNDRENRSLANPLRQTSVLHEKVATQ